MAMHQSITPTINDRNASRIYRLQAVERLSLESEIKALLITANYAKDFFAEGQEDTLPEDYFSCIEELKEILESIDIKSMEFEQRTLAVKRRKRRIARFAQKKEAEL